MTYTPTKLLTVENFIAEYGDDFCYELANGELVEMEPTAPHEAVGGKLATRLGYGDFAGAAALVYSSDLFDSSIL